MSEQRMTRLDARVRRLVADDWAELRAARLAALAEAPYAFASTLARELAFDEELWRSRAGSGWTFGAFDSAAIVGLATGLPPDDLPGDGEPGYGGPGGGERDEDLPSDGAPVWHLVGMWVTPRYRGQGVADRLVGAGPA
jgi:GNAT superfamily N-acetyltransferase